MEQGLPFPMEFRKVNTVSFGDKLKKWIHEKTPGGRMEKYKARYQELLDQTSGAERYVLMQALDRDAKKHAWGTFTRDVVIAAATVGTIVYGGRKLAKNEWNVGKAWGAIRGDVQEKITLVGQFPSKVRLKANEVATELGGSAARGGLIEFAQDAPAVASLLLDNLGAEAERRAVVNGAASAVGAVGTTMDIAAKFLHALQIRLQQSRG